MKKHLILALVVLLSVPSAAFAQDYSDSTTVEDIAPHAGDDLVDSDTAGSYATQDAVSDEDASWAPSTTFDGAPYGDVVQDPSTLEPAGMTITPNQ